MRTNPYLSVLLLLAAAVVGNLFLPAVFWNAVRSRPTELWAIGAGGAVASEAFLLATWSVLGTQAAVVRIPLAAALNFLAAATYAIGLSWPDGSIPREVPIVLCLVAMLLFGLLHLPLWALRKVSRRRIGQGEVIQGVEHGGQFGIRYLLGATACAALLTIAIKSTLFGLDDSVGTIPWYFILLGGSLWVVLTACLGVPCVWFGLAGDRRLLAAGWWGMLMILGLPAIVLAVTLLFGSGSEGEYFQNAVAFALGFSLTTTTALLILRQAGFRLG